MRPNKRKLSALDGLRLAPRAQAYLVWDSLQRGLALRVQPSGYRSYWFVYNRSNKTKWLSIGPADALSLAEARKRAAALMLQVLNGADPAADRHAGRHATTFGTLASRYVSEYAARRNKSYRQAEKLVSRYVLPVWKDIDASTISRADVRALFAGITAPILANQVLAAVSAIFSWAVAQEIIAANPAHGVEHNKTQSRERVLSDAEMPLFWAEFGNAGLPGLALKALLLTGQRPGEICRARFDQIDQGWWTLPGAPDAATGWPGTKNSQSHRIWLPQPVQEIIAGLNIGDPFVFGKSLDLSVTMRAICSRLNAPRATPHDLRRSFGSNVTALGFGRSAMDRLLNHTSKSISGVYDRYTYRREDQHIMEAVCAHLLALAEGRTPSTNIVEFHNLKR